MKHRSAINDCLYLQTEVDILLNVILAQALSHSLESVLRRFKFRLESLRNETAFAAMTFRVVLLVNQERQLYLQPLCERFTQNHSTRGLAMFVWCCNDVKQWHGIIHFTGCDKSCNVRNVRHCECSDFVRN